MFTELLTAVPPTPLRPVVADLPSQVRLSTDAPVDIQDEPKAGRPHGGLINPEPLVYSSVPGARIAYQEDGIILPQTGVTLPQTDATPQSRVAYGDDGVFIPQPAVASPQTSAPPQGRVAYGDDGVFIPQSAITPSSAAQSIGETTRTIPQNTPVAEQNRQDIVHRTRSRLAENNAHTLRQTYIDLSARFERDPGSTISRRS